ncbi:hypothetical protein DFH27DRAFT_599983 [Peziza echinospora]|nr:hypothetical protein DFH27DRAFT_599983 [Peziza echinospora]
MMSLRSNRVRLSLVPRSRGTIAGSTKHIRNNRLASFFSLVPDSIETEFADIISPMTKLQKKESEGFWLFSRLANAIGLSMAKAMHGHQGNMTWKDENTCKGRDKAQDQPQAPFRRLERAVILEQKETVRTRSARAEIFDLPQDEESLSALGGREQDMGTRRETRKRREEPLGTRTRREVGTRTDEREFTRTRGNKMLNAQKMVLIARDYISYLFWVVKQAEYLSCPKFCLRGVQHEVASHTSGHENKSRLGRGYQLASPQALGARDWALAWTCRDTYILFIHKVKLEGKKLRACRNKSAIPDDWKLLGKSKFHVKSQDQFADNLFEL